ncbi:MAG: hypothetical protein KGS45_12310 [Planctomycetes bacterium]|nr:hypothetical protein [Planctomycetota bacterium]
MKQPILPIGIVLALLPALTQGVAVPCRELGTSVLLQSQPTLLPQGVDRTALPLISEHTTGTDGSFVDGLQSRNSSTDAEPEHLTDLDFNEQTQLRIRILMQQRFLSALDSIRDIVGLEHTNQEVAAQALSRSARSSEMPATSEELLRTYQSLSAIDIDLVKHSQQGLPGIDQAAKEARLTEDQRGKLALSQVASAQRIWAGVLMLDFECSVLMSDQQQKRLVDAMASFAKTHWNTILQSPENAWSHEIRTLALREAEPVLTRTQVATVRSIWFINGFLDADEPDANPVSRE